MEIKTVKKSGKGYLVNDTKLVLKEIERLRDEAREFIRANKGDE